MELAWAAVEACRLSPTEVSSTERESHDPLTASEISAWRREQREQRCRCHLPTCTQRAGS